MKDSTHTHTYIYRMYQVRKLVLMWEWEDWISIFGWNRTADILIPIKTLTCVCMFTIIPFCVVFLFFFWTHTQTLVLPLADYWKKEKQNWFKTSIEIPTLQRHPWVSIYPCISPKVMTLISTFQLVNHSCYFYFLSSGEHIDSITVIFFVA
jgi:hypothetical protein